MTDPSTSSSVGSVASSDGTTIAYRTLGDPDAPPVVLVHGWSQSGSAWGPEVLAPLADRFRVVAMDLRGHGDSGVPEEGYDSAQQWADDVAAVLDAADVRADAVLVGWSYGGIVVADYLACLGEDRVAGVVLCGGVTSVSKSAGGRIGPAMITATGGGAFDEDPAVALAAFVELGSALMRQGDNVARQRLLGLSLATPPAVRQKLLTRRVDNDETLQALTIPALVIHGEHDTVVPPTTGRANAEMIPDGRYVGFDESAHAPFLEETERFLSEVTSFVDSL